MKNIIWSIGHKTQINDIVKAQNCTLYDSSGKQYIDLESGVWCTSIGHSNERVNNVISSQINKISHTGFCYCNQNVNNSAQKILEITGLINGKCEFICSGSEAVEFGMRVARTLSEKPKSLTFFDSYFGAYGDATDKENDRWSVFNWLDCSCNEGKGNCTGDCDEFNKILFDEVGIFIFEPGSSSGFVRFPDNKLIQKIVSKIKGNNGIIVVNEITTGVGRTGKWFGFQHYNIQPDIVAIGKGIGNGYPVSVAAISEKIASRLEKTSFLYSQSHQNDPLGATVVSEVVDTIKEKNLIDRSKKLGEYLISKLKIIQAKNPIIKNIRGRGLMMIIEFNTSAQEIYEELIKKGFIVAKRGNSEVLRIDPALTIEKEHIDSFLNTLSEILGYYN